jgi:hypothetical protein
MLSSDNDSQPLQSSSAINEQTPAENSIKIFKCAKCYFRSNWFKNIQKHLKIKHGDSFACDENIHKLDEADAARTLAAYEREHPNNAYCNDEEQETVQCKPFKCGICEFRSGRKINTVMHIRRCHKLENVSANNLVIKLPKDVARQTIGMYFEARDRGHRSGKRNPVYNHYPVDAYL